MCGLETIVVQKISSVRFNKFILAKLEECKAIVNILLNRYGGEWSYLSNRLFFFSSFSDFCSYIDFR